MEHEIFLLSKKTLKLEEEIEMLHTHVADELDMTSPNYEMTPTVEYSGDNANTLSDQLKVLSTGLLKQSKSWKTLEKKFEANSNHIQGIQSENSKLRLSNQEFQRKLDA